MVGVHFIGPYTNFCSRTAIYSPCCIDLDRGSNFPPLRNDNTRGTRRLFLDRIIASRQIISILLFNPFAAEFITAGIKIFHTFNGNLDPFLPLHEILYFTFSVLCLLCRISHFQNTLMNGDFCVIFTNARNESKSMFFAMRNILIM